MAAVWQLLRQRSSSAAAAGSVAAPALQQRGGSGGSFAAAWQPAWRQQRQLCGSMALAVASTAVQQEVWRQRGSSDSGSVAVAAWQRLWQGWRHWRRHWRLSSGSMAARDSSAVVAGSAAAMAAM